MANIVKSEDHNGYHYDVYDNGTRTVTGTIQDEKAERNPYTQAQIGHQYDDPLGEGSKGNGGHIVPASQNGTSDEINVVPQEANTNQKDVRAVERDESKAVKNGAEIETERISFCSNNPNQPDAFMINDHVTMPNGNVSDVHSSFTNVDASKIDGDYGGLDNAQSSYDIGVSMGYSQEEYGAILDATNNEIAEISDYDSGWTSSSYGNVDAANDMSDFGASDDSSSIGDSGSMNDNDSSSNAYDDGMSI